MRKSILLFSLSIVIYSCGVDLDVLEYAKIDKSIELIFPENDSNCTEGTIVSETQSELVFEWQDEFDKGPYIVHLTNSLNSETELFVSENTELGILLNRGIIYSWHVTGKFNNGSETWSFYNAGPGLESTIPLPATALSPVSGATISQTSTTVNLIWKSEDFDNDIISHDIYFGEAIDPDLFDINIIETRYNEIPVESGKTYYWKIVTKDSIGNESTSRVFNFTVG